MHPAATLLIALSGLLAVPALGGWPMAGLAVGIALALRSGRAWWQWLRRSRWLLACLWLVVAYGMAGEALGGMAWAPTYEGVAAANLQAGRLMLSLGLLAWMFERLDHATLPLAVWSLLLPLRRLGWQADRLVVRLALVLQQLSEGLPRRNWQQLLNLDPSFSAAPDRLAFTCPAWRSGDACWLASALLFWCFLVLL